MITQFESIARRMLGEFERTKSLPHQGVKGATREMIVVTEFLRKRIPQKYTLGSGLIMDEVGQYSRQQDIVIYDGFNMPVLEDFESTKVFFSEQCLSVIEVKSTLDSSELDDIVAKAASIWNLKRSAKYRLLMTDRGLTHVQDSRLMLLGFVFESKLTLDQIRDRLQAKRDAGNLKENLSAILILSDKDKKSGIVGYVDHIEIGQVRAVPTQSSLIASIVSQSQGNALFMFYLQLMQSLQMAEAAAMAPDYLAYATTAGLGNINIAISPDEFHKSPHQAAIEIMLHAHEHSDVEVLKAYYEVNSLTISVGIENAHLLPNARFILGNDLVLNPTPLVVWKSLENLAKGNLLEADKPPLIALLDMLRWVSQNLTQENGHISIVTPNPQLGTPSVETGTS